MLLGAIEHVMRKGGDPRTFYGKIYGQEKNLTTSAIARMNLVLHGIEDFQIAREDTLRSPTFTDSSTSGIATFDCVIANPPFSLKEWGRELWEADPWGRAQYGIPPENDGDYAFVQHMIASMAPTGNSRMAGCVGMRTHRRKGCGGRVPQPPNRQSPRRPRCSYPHGVDCVRHICCCSQQGAQAPLLPITGRRS